MSERITDCHVQNFSNFSDTNKREDNAAGEFDTSHINYCQATTIMSEAKDQLAVDIAARHQLVGSNVDAKEEVHAFNDLWNEAKLSLARILTKQGCVSAKLNSHLQALVRCHHVS